MIHANTIAQILRMRSFGWGIRAIAAEVGLFYGEVVDVLREHKATGQKAKATLDRTGFSEAIQQLRREGHSEEVIRANFGRNN